ncbi:MAG: TlpA family protein disulfide reductase [Acidobacteriaceae bacterium]|nr:TlpA family protein disulfide reductase [Acidobacteriaceae bacterium]
MAILSQRLSLFLVLLLTCVRSTPALDVNQPLPHFVAKTMDGERITNDSVKGKVLLLEFWATWCPPCKSDEPAVESVIKDFEKDGLLVVAVNMGEPRRRVKKYLENSPRSSKVVLAEDTTLAAICDANAYPLYVLVDRDGQVAGVQRGAAGEGALRRLLSKAGLSSDDR